MEITRGSSFNPIPLPKAQTTVARCYSFIDIGTVEGFFNGQPTSPSRLMYITWELPKLLGTFNEERGPEPFVVGLELKASTDAKSNFSKLISNWRGQPLSAKEQDKFDPTVMVGKKALISFTVVRKSAYKNENITKITNENSTLKFNGIMAVPKEMAVPAPINENFIWDWDKIKKGEETFDEAKFKTIPKFIQKKMITSEEFKQFWKFTNEPSNASAQGQQDIQDDEGSAEVTEGGW